MKKLILILIVLSATIGFCASRTLTTPAQREKERAKQAARQNMKDLQPYLKGEKLTGFLGVQFAEKVTENPEKFRPMKGTEGLYSFTLTKPFRGSTNGFCKVSSKSKRIYEIYIDTKTEQGEDVEWRAIRDAISKRFKKTMIPANSYLRKNGVNPETRYQYYEYFLFPSVDGSSVGGTIGFGKVAGVGGRINFRTYAVLHSEYDIAQKELAEILKSKKMKQAEEDSGAL